MKRGVQFGRTTAWHSAVGLAAGEQNKRKKGDAIDGEAGGGDWSAVKDYFPDVWGYSKEGGARGRGKGHACRASG